MGFWIDPDTNAKVLFSQSTEQECPFDFEDIPFDQAIKYVGAMKDFKKSGYGSLFFKNGDQYQGEFWNDNQHGSGQIYYSNGDNYHGEFDVGVISG